MGTSDHGQAAGTTSRLVLPSPDLRPWVRCYVVRTDRGLPGPDVSWLPASPSASLHFVFGGTSTCAHSGQLRAYGPEVFVAGPASVVVATRTASPLSTVSVIVWPGVLHGFGALSATALADAFTTAHAAGLPGLAPLVERMAQSGPGAGLRTLEEGLRALLRRHGDQHADSPFRTVDVRRLIRLLRDHGPGTAAAKAGLSVRQFERRFQLQFGTTPKRCQRLARFDRFLTLARTAGLARGQLADLALRLGYYDQSHLHNEFKEFAGFAPLALPRHAQGSAPGAWLYRATGPVVHSL